MYVVLDTLHFVVSLRNYSINIFLTQLQVEIKKDGKLCLRRNGINQTGLSLVRDIEFGKAFQVGKIKIPFEVCGKTFIRIDDFPNWQRNLYT